MRRQARLLEEISEELGGPRVSITIFEALGSRGKRGPSWLGGPGYDLDDRQPKHGKRALRHLFTLMTSEVPSLAAGFPKAPAVALYVLDPTAIDAPGVYGKDAALVALTEADLARGLAPARRGDLPLRAVASATLQVSSSVFSGEGEEWSEFRGEMADLDAHAGGAPLWLQEEDHQGDFLLQFRSRFLALELGEEGTMFVFRDRAFWQT